MQQAIEHRSGGSAVGGGLIGILDLSEDLRLADNHGIQSASHPEQMAYRLRVIGVITVPVQQPGIHAVKAAEPILQDLAVVPLPAMRVYFRAITGRNDQRFPGQPQFQKIVIGRSKTFRRKSDLFPNRDRGSVMT